MCIASATLHALLVIVILYFKESMTGFGVRLPNLTVGRSPNDFGGQPSDRRNLEVVEIPFPNISDLPKSQANL